MSDITRLAYLYQGLPRDIDATANSLQINSLKVGSTTPVELTKVMAQLVADVYAGSAGGKGLPAANLATSAVTGLKIADSALGSSLLKTIAYGGEVAAITQAGFSDATYDDIGVDYGKLKFGQSFTTGSSGHIISKVTIPLSCYAGSGNDPVPLTCEVWTTSGGLPVAKVVGSVTSNTVNVYPVDGYQYKNFVFSTPIALAPSTMYAIVFGDVPSPGRVRQYFVAGDVYAGGTVLQSNAAGSSWSSLGSLDMTFTVSEVFATGATLDVNSLAITEARLAASAVTNAKIADNAITSAKIAYNAVTSAQIAANAVTSAQIAANAVGSTQIAANAVTSTQIAANAVGTAQIAANAVTSTQIATSAVGSTQIADSAVTAVKLNIGTGATAANRAVLESKLAAQRVGVLGFSPTTGNTSDIADSVTSTTLASIITAAATTDVPLSMASIGQANTKGIYCGAVSGAADIGKVLIRVNGTDNGFDDGTGDEIYGVLSESGGVYTLSYKTAAGSAYTILSTDVALKFDFYFIEVMDLWTFGVDRFLIPAIGGVVDATTSNSLNSKVLAESSSRSSADGILSTSITAEASARSLLQAEVDTTQGSLGSAVSGSGGWLGLSGTNYLGAELTITNALKKLDSSLYGEGTTRAAADVAEASSRIAGDAAIQSQLDNMSFEKTYITLVSDGEITVGDVVVLSSTTGRVIQANASAIGTCTHVVGISTQAAVGAGTNVKIQVTGEATVNPGTGFTVGGRLYVSTTAGQAQIAAPTSSLNVVYLLGGATAAGKVFLAPHLEFVVN